MKDPAILFYTSDFLTGTMTMTFEERGKFIYLLSTMHQHGRLSEETIRLLVGSISDNLKKKFRIDENGLWYNERLELESTKRAKFTESRRNNGNKGGRPKIIDINNNLMVNHKDNLMGNENENDNENRIKSKRKLKKPSIEEFTNYFISKGSTEQQGKHWYDYYDVADWHDTNGKPVINWKQKVLPKIESFLKTKSDGRKTNGKIYIDRHKEQLSWAKQWDIQLGLDVPESKTN
jgi:uncharacterized protein YdaU (DUF1376 family)